MAATFTVDKSIALGGTAVLDIGTVTMDNSYPTGGEAIDATGDLGYESMMFEGGPVLLQWDRANQKILAYETAGTVDLAFKEVTAAQDLSAVVCQFWAIRAT